MAATYVSVVLDLFDGSGNPVTDGFAELAPTAQLTDAPDQQVVTQAQITAKFTLAGAPSVRLLAPDSPGPQPPGWAWQISFVGVAGRPSSYSIQPFAGPVAFTATNASPAVFTFTPVSGGLSVLPNGAGVQLSGASLPAGFSAATTYYVVGASGTTFKLAATLGGAALASTSTGSGNVQVTQYNLSSLAQVQNAATFQAYMLQPSSTPSAGMVPIATGAGAASAWGFNGAGATVTVPKPAGATATDTANVTAAITSLVNALSFGPATLLFQDGTYQVDSNALVIRSVSNFAVRSAGRTVLAQAPNRSGLVNNVTGDMFVIADCTDFTVEGLTLDGLRDTVAPMSPLTATASSGQPSVTVAAGQGSRYLAGQYLTLFGGLGTSEQNRSDGFNAQINQPLIVSSITPGGGSGGGDKITFTANLANSYTQVSSTAFSDGFGPYAYAGAYLTPYQCGYQNTVAGRTLSGEDQQCGLHLISCQRFTVSKVTGRNLWESPIRLGTGYETTSLTDGCQQGTVTGCTGYHAYDQGVAVWVSRNITVADCVLNAAGWAGISLTGSDYCTVTGNQILNSVYRIAGDNGNGNGIVTEGGLRNQIAGNIIISPYFSGIYTIFSPMSWGLNNASLPTTSTFLAAGTAGGTSVQVSATAAMVTGGLYSLLDGPRTEAVTVSSIVDGTHVKFTEILQFSHASGISIGSRVAQENVIEGNTIRNPGTGGSGGGITIVPSVRGVIVNNTITGCGFQGIIADYSEGFRPATTYPSGDGSHIEGNVIGNGNGTAIRANGVSQLLIRGNQVYSPNGFGSGIELRGVTDSVLSQNRVTDVAGSYGIWLQAGGPSSIPCARLAISGNSVHRSQLEGIEISLGDSLTITGNVTRSCGGTAGIDLQGVTNSVIDGNVSNSNQNAGIRLEDSGTTHCQYNRVTGNTCRDDGTGTSVATGAAWTQQNGIIEAAGSNNNLFTGNECDSNAAGQLTTAGAASYAWDNILSGTPTGTKTFTGLITSTTGGGAVSLANTSGGSGLILTGISNGVTAAQRIISTNNAWTDTKNAAYFQIDTALAGQRNAVFISGTYGSDVQFDRFQFCSNGTQVTDYFYNATPAPSGLFEVVQSTDKVGLRVIGSSGQTRHLQDWAANGGAVQAYVDASGNVGVAKAGSGLRVAEGSNAKQGTATLSTGTVVVPNTSVTASSRIFLTAQDNSSTGALRVSARTAGTSFTITSSNAGDSGVVAYEIYEPG